MKTKPYLRLLKTPFVLLIIFIMVVLNVIPIQHALAAATSYIKANPTNDTIHVYEGPSGTNITISIDRPSNGVGEDYSASTTVAQASWDPGNPDDLVAEFNLSGIFDLQIGDEITATGVGTTYTVTSLTQVRWFIGLGAGTDPGQIAVEQEVVTDFNATNSNIELLMEVQPNASARTILAQEILDSNPPDVVGPVGWNGANAFHGQWLDLESLSSWPGFDLSPFDPDLLPIYVTDEGRVGLPFAVYPSAIFYNPALFTAAGLNPPPSTYGTQYDMAGVGMVDWDWDTVTTIGKLLTLDSTGKNATETGFNSNDIVQHGFSFGWEGNPTYWGSFWQSGSLYSGSGPYTADVPATWEEAWKWVYDGMWNTTNHPYVPNGNSPYLNQSSAFADGKLAILENPSWYLCCVGGVDFQFGAMPSYNNQVAGRVDADTFRILQSSSHPEEAFTVLSYLVTDDTTVDKLTTAYGAVSGLTAHQPNYITREAALFPSVTTASWNVLLAGLDYPDVPNAEGWMPNYNTAWNYLADFSQTIGTTPNVNMDNAINMVECDLESIFNTDAPLPVPTVLSINRANPSPTAKAQVNFTVTFSQAVTSVDKIDFDLTTTGVTDASVTGVSGSGATRTVTVNTGSGDGTIRLDLKDNDSIIDSCYHTLGGLGSGNGGFTTGQVYIIKKTLTFNSAGATDGWLLESSETSGVGGTLNSSATTFNLGDDAANKQYRGILSFSTASIPDTAVITGVTLKVKKSAIVGSGNPVTIFQGFFADVKTGFFGTASALQTADFQAAASKTVGPTSPTPSANWYSLNLVGAKTFINKLSSNGGVTQIRLRFKLDDNNNAIANYLSLFSGNATNTADRPQLVITYIIP